MAIHRGRKSAAELSIVPIDAGRIRIESPKGLETKAAEIFDEVVASCEPRHFRKSDIPLLANFARATYLAGHYSKMVGEHDSAFKWWCEATKIQMQLATKLRLTPQTRTDSRAANRTTDTSDTLAPWEDRLLGGAAWVPGEPDAS
jgi:hypothetical protein